MRKLALAFSLLASPALATGLQIEVAGEASGVVTIDLFEDVAPQHVAQIAATVVAMDFSASHAMADVGGLADHL